MDCVVDRTGLQVNSTSKSNDGAQSEVSNSSVLGFLDFTDLWFFDFFICFPNFGVFFFFLFLCSIWFCVLELDPALMDS